MIALSSITSIAPISPWREHALCRGIDPGIFHPEHEEDDERASDAACRLLPMSGAGNLFGTCHRGPREARRLGWPQRS